MSRGIVIVGTSSSCGKTFIATLLCAYFAKKGYRVAPFKPQNMSLNSYPALDGGEIALAQAMQAYAAGTNPLTAMNPVLLKPLGGLCEVIIRGKPYAITSFSRYWSDVLDYAWSRVLESFDYLSSAYDLIVVEGAGCCAEPNFLDRDIANLRIAVERDLNAVLVADIERGGAFASIVGVLSILPKKFRERIKGVIINKFVGDPLVLEPAIEWLEKRIGIPVLGVVPKMGVRLWPEDSMELRPFGDGPIDVALIAYPTVSNFGDVEPLRLEPDVRVRIVRHPQELGEPDVVLLPGCRSSSMALEWLKRSGMDRALARLVGESLILGICCGAQVLGRRLSDPYGYEAGVPTHFEGLNVVSYSITYGIEKIVSHSLAEPLAPELEGIGALRGYEIRRGRVIDWGWEKPATLIVERNRLAQSEPDGVVKGKVVATHLHDVLSNPGFRAWVLNIVRKERGLPTRFGDGGWRDLLLKEVCEGLKVLERSVDVEAIEALAS